MQTDKAFDLQPITPEDLDEVVRLHDVYLNYGEGIRPHFQEMLADPAVVSAKCVIGGQMAGLIVYTPGISLSGGHEDICRDIRALTGEALTYTGDAVLVCKPFRRMGISEALHRYARARMAERGVVYALHEFWVHPDGYAPAEPSLQWFGPHRDMGIYKMFYYDFDHYGYYCPICKGKCVCAAHLYLCRIADTPDAVCAEVSQ